MSFKIVIGPIRSSSESTTSDSPLVILSNLNLPRFGFVVAGASTSSLDRFSSDSSLLLLISSCIFLSSKGSSSSLSFISTTLIFVFFQLFRISSVLLRFLFSVYKIVDFLGFFFIFTIFINILNSFLRSFLFISSSKNSELLSPKEFCVIISSLLPIFFVIVFSFFVFLIGDPKDIIPFTSRPLNKVGFF